MIITLIGSGAGPDTLIEAARLALSDAQLVIGAKRLLSAFAELLPSGCVCAELTATDQIVSSISSADCDRVCVLLSGDTGFYSGARRLTALLEGHDVRVLPGVSSVQLLASKLHRPWQDWLLCSAHGVSFDVRAAVCSGKPVFLLTSGGDAPGKICRELVDAGLGSLPVTVGESLGCPDEQIIQKINTVLRLTA